MAKQPLAPLPNDSEVISELLKDEGGPMVQRFATHRDRIDMAIKELESERFTVQERRNALRRQYEALDEGLNQHLSDIEKTLSLYESGFNSIMKGE